MFEKIQRNVGSSLGIKSLIKDPHLDVLSLSSLPVIPLLLPNPIHPHPNNMAMKPLSVHAGLCKGTASPSVCVCGWLGVCVCGWLGVCVWVCIIPVTIKAYIK